MIVVMPRVGMGMNDGQIVQWFAEDGARVNEGDPLFEIETEKLTTTSNAPATGIFHPTRQIGEIVECGDEVGQIVEDAEEVGQIVEDAEEE